MKKKKIKKIILSIIIALIALISVFSCVKVKYTPEPILTPVSVLKPANSVNDNVINPTGTYDTIYLNTSIDYSELEVLAANLNFNDDGGYFVFVNLEIFSTYIYDTGEFYILFFVFGGFEYPVLWPEGWNAEIDNPFILGQSVTGSESFEGINVGQQNNLLTNLISPVPFLFEGTITNTQDSTGFPENDVESVYINTNYTNVSLKDIINTKIGYNDVSFTLTSDTQSHTIRINNTTYECYIYLDNDYIYIYDYTNTAPDVYWWGYSPITLDNRPLLYNADLYTISGWSQDYSFLFSEVDDFGLVDPTYEQGYLDGKNDVINNPNSYGLYTREQYDNRYNYGYENGYTSGVNNVTSNPQEYNLYTYQQYQDRYDEGYLAGLDDGAGTNINFQYVESVLSLIGNFLNIEVLPGVKLSYALGVIIILTIISIIKMVVK